MSLFGIRYPRLQNSGETAFLLLQNSKIIPSWQEPDEVIKPSVINGVRNIVTKGDYSSFEILVYLYKYANPATKLAEIYGWNHDDVYVYPHIDGAVSGDLLGKAVQNSSSAKVLFHVTHIQPFYMKNTNLVDACVIKLVSNDYTDFSKSIQ